MLYGDLQAFIAHSSKLHFLVSTFLSTMSDINDLLLAIVYYIQSD